MLIDVSEENKKFLDKIRGALLSKSEPSAYNDAITQLRTFWEDHEHE